MVKRRTQSGYQISNRPFPVFSLAGEYKGNGHIFIKSEPCPICKNRHKKDSIYGEWINKFIMVETLITSSVGTNYWIQESR